MSRISRTTCRLAAAMAALVMAAGCSIVSGESNDDSGGLTTVRVAHNSNAAALPAQIAKARGFFADHGLNVELTKVENISTLPAALGKSFDIALSVHTMVISAEAQGIPLVQVAGVTVQDEKNPQSAVIASPDSRIKSIKDLAGKTLGVLNDTGTFHIATRNWLEQVGVDPDSVHTVQVDAPALADQLASGRVDAVEAVAPFSTMMLNSGKGNVDLGDPYRSLAPQIAALGWMSARDWAKDNRDTITSFTDALQEGIDYAGQHEADAKKILQSYTNASDDVMKVTVFPTFTAEVRAKDWQLWLDAMKKVGGFHGSVDPRKLVLSED